MSVTIHTCTPVAFHANEAFFCRDTGLISATLRVLGAESKTIMPLPWHEDDQREHIIRVAPGCLRSTRWWRRQGIDAVVLYSWGDPRYTLIARAIRRAGIRLAIQLDFNGAFLPAAKFPRLLRDYAVNKLRALHLGYADVISTSPRGAEHLRHARYYGPAFADKCMPLVTPIAPRFRYSGARKEARVICVGNWKQPVKRPEFLADALGLLLGQDSRVGIDICGPVPAALETWHAELPPAQKARVRLHGSVDNAQLPALYNAAQISLCTSASEGTHNASGEALCCGCSVVTPRNPERLPMVHWYTSKSSGLIAQADTPDAVAQTLCRELANWRNGQRDPAAISSQWAPMFRADLAIAPIIQRLLPSKG